LQQQNEKMTKISEQILVQHVIGQEKTKPKHQKKDVPRK